MKNPVKILTGLMLVLVLTITAVALMDRSRGGENLPAGTDETQQTATAEESEGDKTTISNPASSNCLEKGGELILRNQPAGQFNVCAFADGKECEEWALLRGACPTGGVDVSGYATDAARYCALVGGEYARTAKATEVKEEQGSCKTPEGNSCDAWELWNGECTLSLE